MSSHTSLLYRRYLLGLHVQVLQPFLKTKPLEPQEFSHFTSRQPLSQRQFSRGHPAESSLRRHNVVALHLEWCSQSGTINRLKVKKSSTMGQLLVSQTKLICRFSDQILAKLEKI